MGNAMCCPALNLTLGWIANGKGSMVDGGVVLISYEAADDKITVVLAERLIQKGKLADCLRPNNAILNVPP